MGIASVSSGVVLGATAVPSLAESVARVMFATVDSIVTSKAFVGAASVLSTQKGQITVIAMSCLLLGAAITAYAATQDQEGDDEIEEEDPIIDMEDTGAVSTPTETRQGSTGNPFDAAKPRAAPFPPMQPHRAGRCEAPRLRHGHREQPPAHRGGIERNEERQEEAPPSQEQPPVARDLACATGHAVQSSWNGYHQHAQNVQFGLRVALYGGGQVAIRTLHIANDYFQQHPDWCILHEFGRRVSMQPRVQQLGQSMSPWQEPQEVEGPSSLVRTYCTARSMFQWLSTNLPIWAGHVQETHRVLRDEFYGERLDPYVEMGQGWVQLIQLTGSYVAHSRIGQVGIRRLQAIDAELNVPIPEREIVEIPPEDRVDMARVLEAGQALLYIDVQIVQYIWYQPIRFARFMDEEFVLNETYRDRVRPAIMRPIQTFNESARDGVVRQSREWTERAIGRVVMRSVETYRSACASICTSWNVGYLSYVRMARDEMEVYAAGSIAVFGWDDEAPNS